MLYKIIVVVIIVYLVSLKTYIWYLPTIFFGLALVGLTVLPIFPNELKIFMESIIPSRIYTLFPEIGFENIQSYPRINKWLSSISYISNKPLFGWGAASFPILYSFKKSNNLVDFITMSPENVFIEMDSRLSQTAGLTSALTI